MSAPDTNVEKQKRRHRGPLLGIAVVLVFAAVFGFIFLAEGGDEVLGAPENAGGVLMQSE